MRLPSGKSLVCATFLSGQQRRLFGLPDCRPAFIAAFERLANGDKCGRRREPFVIHAPLQHMNKAEIITMGLSLGVDYSLTVSCYQADVGGRLRAL
jgi:7-cyano-7-deazaguanine synthase